VSARRILPIAVPLAILVLLALLPKTSLKLPYVFQGALDTPGTLQLLALMCVFAGVALSYDLLFGYTGLLSFGHALYFAAGVYMPAIAITRWHWSLAAALAFTAAVGIILPLLVGAVSLRVTGIAFAMVTLAFAQAGSILAFQNPHRLTGGEEGVGLDYRALPDGLVGVFNTKNLYWIALAYVAVVFVVSRLAVESSPGHVWQAIRENELRVRVLGLRTFDFKLMAFVLSSFLATAGGVVYVLLIGGATPDVTSASFTLSLLVMVVIGGAGTRYGALLGGALYTFANHRLADVAGSSTISSLPDVFRTPLREPLFILGVLFILFVFFVPGGLARLSGRGRRRGLRSLEQALVAQEEQA
jgi:branched-chain amino acid transport system permease protein